MSATLADVVARTDGASSYLRAAMKMGFRTGVKQGDIKSLPNYRSVFIWVFLAAELATFMIEGWYLVTGNNTLLFFVVDTLLFTAISLFLLLTANFLIGRVLSAYFESRDRFEDLVNNSPDTIYYLDEDGRVYWMNEVGFRFLGYERLDEVIGKPFAELVHTEDRERVLACNREAVNTHRSSTAGLTFRVALEGGADVWVELHSHLMFDGDGAYEQEIGILRDITERRKNEEELKRVNTELEGYAHTVSHDLKNPIHTMMLACHTADTLLERPLTPGVREETRGLLAAAIKSAEKANLFIEDLLLLAESQQAPADVRSVRVFEKVEEVLTEYAGAIEEKGIRVSVDEDMGQVKAAPVHVYQLFANLIKNAIEYNDSRRPAIHIQHMKDGSNGVFRYLVRDNGPGIPAGIIDRVFVPFTRGPSGKTGIGLSIVEKIVKAYGGEIKAYNAGGACFEFTLAGGPENVWSQQ